MGVFAALGMAARRWYLLIPLALIGGGVSWLAYGQMPASYTATIVHEVKVAERSASATSSGARRGLTLAPPRPAPDPVEQTGAAAAELVGSVRPQAPPGALPGRPGTQPITLSRQPDQSSVTVRAVADSAAHARQAVEATTRQLADRLRELDQERGASSDQRFSLATSTPLAVDPPLRAVGRRVGLVTLAFCLMMSVLLAAAVERSARRRRLLAEESTDGSEAGVGDIDRNAEPGDADADRADRTAGERRNAGPVAEGTADEREAGRDPAGREPADRESADRGGRSGPGRGTGERNRIDRGTGERGAGRQGSGRVAALEPVLAAEPELLSGAEPALLADARPPMTPTSQPAAAVPSRPSAGSRPLPPGGSQPLPSAGSKPLPAAGPPPLSGSRPVPVAGSRPGPSSAGGRVDDDAAVTDVVPVLTGIEDDGPNTAVIPAAVAGPPSRPNGPARPTGPRGGRPPMEPRAAPSAEMGAGSQGPPASRR